MYRLMARDLSMSEHFLSFSSPSSSFDSMIIHPRWKKKERKKAFRSHTCFSLHPSVQRFNGSTPWLHWINQMGRQLTCPLNVFLKLTLACSLERLERLERGRKSRKVFLVIDRPAWLQNGQHKKTLHLVFALNVNVLQLELHWSSVLLFSVRTKIPYQ